MARYKPSFRMTNAIIDGLTKISEQMGKITGLQKDEIPTALREECCVRNIFSTLAMDEKNLSLEDVQKVLQVGAREELGFREDGAFMEADDARYKAVRNAHRLYRSIAQIEPISIEELLRAHSVLMQGLCRDAGTFRTGEVRVYEGNRVIHVAAPFRFVSKQISDLLEWYRSSQMHPLVKSAVFRFEFEAIHPFSEGNGRIGRLWHRILMGQWKELFYYLPIEEWIINDQDKYFSALGRAYKEGDGNAFVEMFLGFLQIALKKVEDLKEQVERFKTEQDTDQESGRKNDQSRPVHSNILKLLEIVGDGEASALEMMGRLGLKHRPTFRSNYLNPALESGALVRTVPDKPNSKNQRYRKKSH